MITLLFNMLSMFIIAFLPKEQASFNFMAAFTVCIDFGAQENKIYHCFHSSPSICNEVMGPDAAIFITWMLSFKPDFHSCLSPLSRGSLVPFCFLPLEWYHLHIWDCWYFSWQSWFQLVIHPACHFTWCTLHRSRISRGQYTAFLYSFSKFELVQCSMDVGYLL